MCYNLTEVETNYKNCNGVEINGKFLTLNSCLSKAKSDEENCTVVSIPYDLKLKKLNCSDKVAELKAECLWGKQDQVPFLNVLDVNGTLHDFFALFSKICESKYNMTLATGEYCIESYWKIKDTESIRVGTAVWYPERRDYNHERAILIGLVKFSKLIKDHRFFVIVKIFKKADIFNVSSNQEIDLK